MSYKYSLSVILLVYNTSEYLNECLYSLASQTMKNIEIIAVDYESTDNNLEILKTKVALFLLRNINDINIY